MTSCLRRRTHSNFDFGRNRLSLRRRGQNAWYIASTLASLNQADCGSSEAVSIGNLALEAFVTSDCSNFIGGQFAWDATANNVSVQLGLLSESRPAMVAGRVASRLCEVRNTCFGMLRQVVDVPQYLFLPCDIVRVMIGRLLMNTGVRCPPLSESESHPSGSLCSQSWRARRHSPHISGRHIVASHRRRCRVDLADLL